MKKMDEDEEDVIFENSPLYKHLQKAGIEGITAETLNHIKPNIHSKPMLKQVDYASLFIDVLGKFYQNVVFYCSKTKWGTENLEAWYHMTTLKHVQNSKALEEEDSAFLENYINCNKGDIILTEPSVYDCFTKWNGPINYLSTGFLLYTLIWCTGIFPMNLRPMADILAVGFGICIMITCFDVCFYWWKRRIFMDTAAAIEKCIKTSEKVLHLTRQSLRLIQETELVSRGFTLVSQRVAVSGLEQHSSKLCTELRKTTFYTARTGVLTFREATLKLLELHPLIPEVDSVCNYLASVPLTDYGPCLQLIDQQADNNLHLAQLTDNFSVAALRGMNQLFALYLSEFIRRLTLCFILDAQIQGSPAPFDKLASLMEDLFIKLEKEQTKLQKSYDFHRSSPLNREPSKPKNMKLKSKTGDFYTAVHSLDLHLQAALSRTQELSSKLEKLIEDENNQSDSSDNPDRTEEDQESWLRVMKEVKGEIEACKGCWEEGIGRLKKSTDKTVPKLESLYCEIKEKKDKEINIIDIGEYIIEDQVFEGYTDPDEAEDNSWTWEPMLSPEEKEKRKREKEETKRLLSELRSVISVRAEDRERREKVALEKSKGLNSSSFQTTENVVDITVRKESLAHEISLKSEDSEIQDTALCHVVQEVKEIHMVGTISENLPISVLPETMPNSDLPRSNSMLPESKPGLLMPEVNPESEPNSTLSNSDILSSTKTDLSQRGVDQASSLENISPILSEDEERESEIVSESLSFRHDDEVDLSQSRVEHDDLPQKIDDLNNSAICPEISSGTFASISALPIDENKFSGFTLDSTACPLDTVSDSEFSATSSKDDNCTQNSVVISSSCTDESLLKTDDTSKSSSGFFESKDSHKYQEGNMYHPNETYSVFSKNPSFPSVNPDQLCDTIGERSSSNQISSLPLNTGIKNSKTILNCDDVNENFNPDKHLLTDANKHSDPNNFNSPENVQDSKPLLTFKENTQRNNSHADLCSNFHAETDQVDSSESSPKEASVIESESQNFLEQSIGFTIEQDLKSMEIITSKDVFETENQQQQSINKDDIQSMTYEHDPDLDNEESNESSEQSLEVLSPDTSSSSTGETEPNDLDIRISRLPGANLAFSANIAAMAAARSVSLNLNIDTFGDSSSDEECQCTCNGDC